MVQPSCRVCRRRCLRCASGLPGPGNYYDVSHDGQRFLVASTPEEAATQPMTVVLNWLSDLKR